MKSFIKILLFYFLVQNFTSAQHPTSHADFDINKIKLVIANTGKLGAYDSGEGLANGQFEESNFLYSGGFLISGFVNDSLFANGNFNTAAVENYTPGSVGSDKNDPQFKLYIVKSTDPPFSQSWIEWETAVTQGALFYDGDDDAEYNPVDKNNNGQWDENEDRPDFLGDMTAWCI